MHSTERRIGAAIIVILICLPVGWMTGWLPAWLAFLPHAGLLTWCAVALAWQRRGPG